MRYSVHCPSAPFENTSFVNLDDCWGLCLDLSEQYGYAEVRYGECLMGSYGSYANGGYKPVSFKKDIPPSMGIANANESYN